MSNPGTASSLRDVGIGRTGPISSFIREQFRHFNAAALVDSIPVAELRREMRATIRDWGRDILDRPDPYANRFYQGFIVLNYCRMLHDFVVGRPGSKRAGAEWAKATLDPKWSDLIDRAWGGRPNPAVSVRTPADPADFARTLDLVSTVIDETERYAARVEAG